MATNGIRINMLAIEPGVDGGFSTCRMRFVREQGMFAPKPNNVEWVSYFFKQYASHVKNWSGHQRNSNINRAFKVNGGLQGRLQAEARRNKINVLVVPNDELPAWLEEFIDWYCQWTVNTDYHQRLQSGHARRDITKFSADLRMNYIMRVPVSRSNWYGVWPQYSSAVCMRAVGRMFKAAHLMKLPTLMPLMESWQTRLHTVDDYQAWCRQNIPPYDPKFCHLTKKIKEAIMLGGAFSPNPHPVMMDKLAHEIWDMFEADDAERIIGKDGYRRQGTWKSRKR